MALPPKFAGQKLNLEANKHSVHTIELYLDYVCPFSKKMFDTVYSSVHPLILGQEPYKSKLQIIFRQQVQPWHPCSTLVHEAAVAVLQIKPDKFWEFSHALFDKQEEYFDVNVVNETRNETYKRLARLASSSVGIDEEELYGKLVISNRPGKDGSLNSGNKVTNDLKVLIKAARQVGVHVSPTVLFNGIVENSISSDFTEQQWKEWLEKNIV